MARQPFLPPAVKERGSTAIDVVFPDGSRATLVFPAELHVDRMPAQPDVTFLWDGRYIGSIVLAHGGHDRRILDGAAPLGTIERPGGLHAEVWLAAAQGRSGSLFNEFSHRWLVFPLEDWTVHVPLDRSVDADKVFRAVTPKETIDGWVVVETARPASLAEGFGEAGGPQVSFGDGDPIEGIVRGVRLVQIAPSSCAKGFARPEIALSRSYGAVCLAGGRLFLNVQVFDETPESEAFVVDLIHGVEAARFRAAS